MTDDAAACIFCQETVANADAWRRHLEERHVRPHVCPKCGVTFTNARTWLDHPMCESRKGRPTAMSSFPCGIDSCQERFTSASALVDHKIQQHMAWVPRTNPKPRVSVSIVRKPLTVTFPSSSSSSAATSTKLHYPAVCRHCGAQFLTWRECDVHQNKEHRRATVAAPLIDLTDDGDVDGGEYT